LDRLAGKVSQIMSAWTRQRGEDGQNMSARTGLGEDNVDRTASTGQPRQDIQDETAGIYQPGQVRLDRQRRQDAQHMTARI
jgi:hypothetical protein